jgi:hypothetical protein
VSPETPGAIQDGGELGYSLVHAYGAAFDNPDLIVAGQCRRRGLASVLTPKRNLQSDL